MINNSEIPVPPGCLFSALDKLGHVAYFEFVCLHEEDACGNTVRLRAVGKTRDDYSLCLSKFKEKNPQIESVQRITLDEFCIVEVEPAWFGERKITVGGV